MRDIAAHLPPKRCLVLLISDFLMPLTTVDAALGALARHNVTPIVMDSAPAQIPAFGLCRVLDAESGQMRLLLMRPALRRRWRQAETARHQALNALFAKHGRMPFNTGRDIDIAALSRHLVFA
jgi:hypothetical protein